MIFIHMFLYFLLRLHAASAKHKFRANRQKEQRKKEELKIYETERICFAIYLYVFYLVQIFIALIKSFSQKREKNNTKNGITFLKKKICDIKI